MVLHVLLGEQEAWRKKRKIPCYEMIKMLLLPLPESRGYRLHGLFKL